MKKPAALLIVLCLAVSLLCAMAETETLTDMTGRVIGLGAPAERIVVLMPADAEILTSIGAADRIVGVGAYCATSEELAVMPELADVPVVNSGYDLNIEQILNLNPDLIVMTVMGQTEEQVAQLEGNGARVVVTNAQTLEDIYFDILLLGRLTGKTAEAQAKVDEMRSAIAALGAQAGQTGKTVYFEESPLQWGLWTAGKDTYMNDIAELVGLTNIFADLDGHNAVSEDAVIMRKPDMILTTTQYYGGDVYPDEEILARAGWGDIPAVIEGRVAYDPTNAVSLPGPRVVDVARMLFDLATGEEAVPAA